MPLFTTSELSAYLQRPVSDDQFSIALSMVTDALQAETAGRVADPPQTGVKSVALTVAGRVLTNPAGVRSETAGAVAVTYSDALTGLLLTKDERRRLRRAVGLASGGSSVDVGSNGAESQRGWWRGEWIS